MWGLASCRWWPLVGFLLFLPMLFGHFGFGCHRSDPGVTTDPPSSPQALSSGEAPTDPSTPSLAFLLVPIGGGAAALISRASRRP